MKLFPDKQKRLDKQLIKAATAGDAAKVTALLDAGATLNQVSVDGPLFMAAISGDTPKHLEVIRLLIDRGAEINLANKQGGTALMAAANKGHVNATRLLLAEGADHTLKAHDKTAFDWSLASGNAETIFLMQSIMQNTGATDEVTLQRTLGNRTLEEVFNFANRERLTMIRVYPNGPVEAITRQNFRDIDDRHSLRHAFALYVRQGGKRPESDIFPEVLAKVRALPGLSGRGA